MLQAGLGDGVEHLEGLVQVVVAVVAVGHLELQAQLELGVGDLLEAVLDLAGLDEGHDLAVERRHVRRVQVQDLVAYLPRKYVSCLNHDYMRRFTFCTHYQIFQGTRRTFVLIKQTLVDSTTELLLELLQCRYPASLSPLLLAR